MHEPDFAGAKSYVEQRLRTELPRHLLYHNLQHTLNDVLAAAVRLAQMEGVTGEDYLLLTTAVMFHDLGFVECYTGHEAVSIRLAQEVLPSFGFNPQQIQVITGIIQTTQLPQTPHTRLEQIMADADLDVIGRDDFFPVNANLRDEHASMGWTYTDEQWYTSQLRFLTQHAYFTSSARQLRDAKKQQNILEMTKLLENIPMPIPNPSSHQPQDLTMNERVAILRAVNLFSETPDEILTEVAELLTPVEVDAGQAIIHKGDPGDSMYIIVSGHVLIHDGEMELSHLGPADVFGEMALVDDMPRVATGTAQDSAQLLRLDQATFYQLMQHRPEVTRGVIRVLNRHLRGRVRDMAEDFLYIQQVQRITAAAAALEAGLYDFAILDEVGRRDDELGQLARVFQRMANEVQAREQRLKQEVQALRIQIDEVKKAQQVAEITESEYFQQLQQKIQRIRKR